MYRISRTPQFDRDVKTCAKRHWEMDALREAVAAVAMSDAEPIPRTLRDHPLRGTWKEHRAVHVQSKKNPPKDKWVLVYRILGDEVIFVRTGDHDVYENA